MMLPSTFGSSPNQRNCRNADSNGCGNPAVGDHARLDFEIPSSCGGVEGHAETTTSPKWVGGTAQVKSASEVTAPVSAGRVLDVGGANPLLRKQSLGSDPSGFNPDTAGIKPGPQDSITSPTVPSLSVVSAPAVALAPTSAGAAFLSHSNVVMFRVAASSAIQVPQSSSSEFISNL